MRFEKLIKKVAQAEDALEAHERQAGADLRQLRQTWRSAWTPGRIVMAGLGTGFAAGWAEPLHSAMRGGSVVRIVSLVSGLFASVQAQLAAAEAGHAASSAEHVADAGMAAGYGDDWADERIARAAAAARSAGGEAADP